MNPEELMEQAFKARESAYAPYSRFQVGAALLGESGRVYRGANVENASYGLTVCAERVAVFNAVTAGETRFTTLALAGSGEGFIYPCGACLQVLAEFAPGLEILVSNQHQAMKAYRLHDMLPQVFSLIK